VWNTLVTLWLKPSEQGETMTDCPNCEYHRKRAQLWRDEAYKQAGHPLPEREDDNALIDAGLLNSDLGMLRTKGTRTWVGLTEAQCGVLWKVNMTPFDYYKAIEAKLKEKNDRTL
jgi:hypothetical protein